MNKKESVIALDADLGHFPPWSTAQQDAQLESLRFAFHQLARTLHESGQLSIPSLLENLDSAEWLFAGNQPGTLEAVRQLAEGLDYMQQKVKQPRRQGKKSAPE